MVGIKKSKFLEEMKQKEMILDDDTDNSISGSSGSEDILEKPKTIKVKRRRRNQKRSHLKKNTY
jgi:hypothetical protein